MAPVLVTGAGGRVGGVGHAVVELLRRRGMPVAFVHHDDERAASLRSIGAEAVVGGLTAARLHAANCHDRFTRDVETISGLPATTVRDFVASHADRYKRAHG